MEFYCKQFALNHGKSSMKVGTDAILLAGFTAEYFAKSVEEKHDIKTVLDVGTGCGILALCMAQAFTKADVTAIDIDPMSVEQAEDNFASSAFDDRLHTVCTSFQNFSLQTTSNYDLIISNPPFFTSSLHSPDIRRNAARHNVQLPLEDFVLAVDKVKNAKTAIAVILPAEEMNKIKILFKEKNIFPVQSLQIFPANDKPLKRIITIFKYSSDGEILQENTDKLMIRTDTGEYTEDYMRLTSAFLL